MFSHPIAAFWFSCFILLLPAYPSLHLHWWWSNHEHALPEQAGSEKPWCLVSVQRTLFFILCLHSRVCFMGRINADNHLLILLLCLSQMGSQEQPRAMEQNGTHSTVQSMNSYGVFTQTYLIKCMCLCVFPAICCQHGLLQIEEGQTWFLSHLCSPVSVRMRSICTFYAFYA